MNYYRTEAAKVAAEMPQNTVNMTAKEIVAYGMKHFKTGGVRCDEPLNKFTAYMMAVSDAIFKPGDWKSPIYAILPDCGLEWAKAAVIWYHGAEPIESFVGVYSSGYACD